MIYYKQRSAFHNCRLHVGYPYLEFLKWGGTRYHHFFRCWFSMINQPAVARQSKFPGARCSAHGWRTLQIFGHRWSTTLQGAGPTGGSWKRGAPEWTRKHENHYGWGRGKYIWWFGTMEFYDVPETVGNFIIPTVTHSIIFQRGGELPPTRYGWDKQ